MKPKYHVKLGKKRTTVTLNKVLSELLALKLNKKPESTEAHTAVREWLQAALDENSDPGRALVSQWLAGEAALEVADSNLRKQWLKQWDT